MLLLQALFLWVLVSAMVLGGAYLFHRLFPQESCWWGFLVPPLALVVVFNFLEHLVSIPSLLLLLPILLVPALLLVAAPASQRAGLLLPGFVFLVSFGFTFLVRCLQPNIEFTSDGISDLNMVNNYLQGGTVPPPDTWMPPLRHEWYYSLQHYAASLVGRLLGVKIGVAYNLSHALLSALTCVAGAAVAHRLSGGRTWITLAVPFLLEACATGSSAYIFLTSFLWNKPPSLWLTFDLSGGVSEPPDGNILWKLLRASDTHYETLRLQVPGFWTWRDEYHANASGHFLTLLATLVLAELSFLRRTLWPWAMAVLVPVLAVVASAWALPITLLLCAGGLVWAVVAGRRPSSLLGLLVLLFGALLLLWPAFYSATSSPVVLPMSWTKPESRVPIVQFLVQWWPIIALWIGGCVLWRQIGFGARWVLLIVPFMLVAIELITIESRYNTIEKMWGYTWGAALITLFPIIAACPRLPARLLTLILLLCSVVNLSAFLYTLEQNSQGSTMFHLEGSRYLTLDDQKRKMLNVLRQVHGLTFLSGKSDWCYNEAPALATFSNNRSYIAWSWFESLTNYQDEADYRVKLDHAFYDGSMPNRLQFLQANNIVGVLVWPGDALDDAFVETLKRDLGSSYEYIDCRGSGDHNAGVFLQRPLPRE